MDKKQTTENRERRKKEEQEGKVSVNNGQVNAWTNVQLAPALPENSFPLVDILTCKPKPTTYT